VTMSFQKKSIRNLEFEIRNLNGPVNRKSLRALVGQVSDKIQDRQLELGV